MLRLEVGRGLDDKEGEGDAGGLRQAIYKQDARPVRGCLENNTIYNYIQYNVTTTRHLHRGRSGG